MKEDEMAEEKEAPKRVSRRQFVKGAAAVAGAGALASCAPPATPAPGETAAPAPTCPPAGECPPPAWIPAKWDYEADVVVVGIGFAGQAAAIDAADAGASVLVLEKSPREHAGGSSAANYTHDHSYVGLTVEGNIEYVTSQTWGTVENPELIRAYCEGIFDLQPWIASLGGTVNWEYRIPTFPTIPGGDKMGLDEETDLNQWDWSPPEEWMVRFPSGSGKSPFQEWMMDEVLPGREVQVMCDTPAIELIQDGATKEILGVKALTGVTTGTDFKYSGGEEIYVKAKKAVILAIGGYEYNETMRTNFAPHAHSARRPSGFVTCYGSPYLTGDGLTMATKVGAQLWHMNKKEMHNFASALASEELGCGRPVEAWADGIAVGPGIVVNRDGVRFYNEYFYGGHSDNRREWDHFIQKLEAEDDINYCDYPHHPFYWIFDDTTMKADRLFSNSQFGGVFNIHRGSDDNLAELAKGWFIKADTIEELGNMIECKDFFGRVKGMDAAGLAAEVAKYNQYCAAGEDLDFGRRPSTMEPIVTPPFYAMEICECQTNTQGGAKHNEYWQTLDAYDVPIPRLYNCGEFGSIFGHLYNGAQNIPEASVSGRVAGKHAAALEPWDA
jgi:hypothetical protein